MNHYFIADENLRSNPQTYLYQFKTSEYVFTTDSGVFSVGKMDPYTDILLRNLPPVTGTLLDLGCGCGCIGIALAKEYALSVTQTDINPRAVELTLLNCKQNGVTTNAFVSDGFESINENFDTIILNPPIHAGKETVFGLCESAAAHLNANGKFYIVILKKHGADSAKEKLIRIYKNCETVYKKKGCFIFCCVQKLL